MGLIKISDFNISSFAIGIPMKRPKGGYGSQLKYNGNEIIIQTPICLIDYIDKETMGITFKLADNFEYFQFFCSIHELIIKYLMRYNNNEDYDILTNISGNEEIRKNFNSYVKKINDTEMNINMKIRKNTLFFTKNKQEISGLEFKRGDYVVCLIKPNQLSMDSISANHSWDCVQCLKWKNKSN